MNNVEATSTWTQTSDEDFNKGESVNLTIKGIGDDADLQIDISDLHHWTDKQPTSNPGGYYWHTMASICNDDKVAVFGGLSSVSGYDGKIWIYDVSNNTWASKSPSTKPIGRIWPAMAGVWNTDNLVLFGGYLSVYKNDTWVYNLSANTWTQKNHSTKPGGRYMHGMASVWNDDKVVLFGGFGGGLSGETWIYDLGADTWTQKNHSTKPSARYRPMMATIYNDDKVVLFSGHESGGYSDETWVYDVSDNTWTLQSPTTIPSSRAFTAMASIYGTDNVVLFGGISSGYTDDTWIYDLSDNTWEEQILDVKPSPRQMHAMASVGGTDKVVIFGGVGSGGWKSNTWTYEHFLPTRNGTFVSAPYDTGTNSSFYTFDWYAEVPDDTSIRLQLRSAANESLLTTKDFVGTDGLPDSYYTNSPSDIWSGHNGDRWIQYKVYFNIDIVKESPSLKDVTILYNCLPETIVVGPSDGSLLAINNPVFKWTFVDMDSDEQKAFQVLISDSIDFDNISYDSGEQTSEEQGWEYPTGTSYSELPDGTWYWKVRTKDEDGAWTKYSTRRKIIIDTTIPSSVPIIPINNGFYQSLTLVSGIGTDPKPSSGLDHIKIAIQRLSDNYYWDGEAWAPLVTWILANGTSEWTYDISGIQWASGTKYCIQSRAADITANIEVPGAGNTFTMDMGKPSSEIKELANEVWLNKLNEISGSSVDIDSSGLERVEISIQRASDKSYWYGQGWINSGRWLTTVGTSEWTYNSTEVQWTTGDQYIICSRATDKVNNVEQAGSGSIINYDAQPPDHLSITINDDNIFTTLSNVDLTLQAGDIGSKVSKMAFRTEGTDWIAWEPYNISRSFDLSLGDGEKRVYFKVCDLAGNIAEPVFDSIILDRTPPNDLSIKINEGDKYTNTNLATLTLDAVDLGSGLSDTSLSYDGKTWLSWEPYKSARTISLPTDDGDSDGEKTIYFKVNDKAGNIAKPVSDSIILDTKPPDSLSNIINDGANETNSTWVSLELRANDSNSGLYQISFSDDNETWSAWENYNETKIYNLPFGDGVKTIYFRVSDHAGNVAEPIASTILLNTSTPAPIKVKPSERSSPNEYDWSFLILIILIIFIVTFIGVMAVITKRKKQAEEESLLAGAITIKPGGLTSPVISYDQMPSTPKVPALPGTVSIGGAKQTTGQAMPTSVPLLAKSTQSAQVQTILQQVQAQKQPVPTQAVQALPQLPPARIQTPTTTVAPIVSIPTAPAPTPTPIPTPTPTTPHQPQVTPTPKLAKQPESATETTIGHTVHLPEATKLPTTPTLQPQVTPQQQLPASQVPVNNNAKDSIKPTLKK